ncbi:hypothetical protein JCM19300_4543 [Algibacter lectus]|uniref:Uncharacterized protein n=1 Tax=Algibacter lectus TaxID=221126 RepID=A0A090WX75_9FLAO|nr:hypothetical protein JCM19300_4543 [Algibacter lectus]GAL81566.1 hypothetical protein JCM19274_411 [Algibacter lectus]
MELFLCGCTYATQKSDCEKPDPCGNAQIIFEEKHFFKWLIYYFYFLLKFDDKLKN